MLLRPCGESVLRNMHMVAQNCLARRLISGNPPVGDLGLTYLYTSDVAVLDCPEVCVSDGHGWIQAICCPTGLACRTMLRCNFWIVHALHSAFVTVDGHAWSCLLHLIL